MSEPFIAEIKIFAGNFAPRGYAFCDGQLLSIAQNTALFSLVGTTYGGDGRTTFGLPDLKDRAPMHVGTGPGLTQRRLGYKSGEDTVTLNLSQIPSHTHQPRASSQENNQTSPATHVWGNGNEKALYRQSATYNTNLGPGTISPVGGNQRHNNMQPYLTLSFIIALVGLYPSRN
jgi:microcystin-dependent protein